MTTPSCSWSSPAGAGRLYDAELAMAKPAVLMPAHAMRPAPSSPSISAMKL